MFIFVFISISLGGGSSSTNLQTINAGEDVEKRELSYTVGGNANWYNHYGEYYGDSLKKKNLGIKPYDPAIPQLDIYPEETRTERDTCTPVFTAALFTIVRTWKQPRKQPQQMNG